MARMRTGASRRLFVFRRGDDDERAGRGQRSEARGSFYYVVSVERELVRQSTIEAQVHGRLDGKADGVAGLDQKHRRVASDGKRRDAAEDLAEIDCA